MGKLSLVALQTAIRTILVNDATLTSLTGSSALTSGARVFDGVPDDQAYPYISFADKHVEPVDTFDKDVNDDRIMLYVWSQSKGDAEALNIASRVNDLLHGASLDLTASGFRNIPSSLQLEMLDTMREPDGRTRKAIMRYKTMNEET